MFASVTKFVTATGTKSAVSSIAVHAVVLGVAGWMVTTRPFDRVRLPGKPVTLNVQVDDDEVIPTDVSVSIPPVAADRSVVVSPTSALVHGQRYEQVPTFAQASQVSPDGLDDEVLEETIAEDVDLDAAEEMPELDDPQEAEATELPTSVAKQVQSQQERRRQQKLEQQGHDETAPRLQPHAPLVYPAAARRRGDEGTALLELTIATTGEITRVVLKESSGHPVLDAAAVNAVQQWRYAPRTIGGVPVECVEVQPIHFKLRD